ncbi:polysaccharide biosynthesis/export family protein [Persicobacter diffluens]|uniref:Polysaccharide export outer membrane protein n=1 Tax=Persicobacter diffluens TaxID=981 RepID=A0AAN5AJZ2_9BACT|nr:polysaccharide export outer membrane protein [Persicobacter diffluens]
MLQRLLQASLFMAVCAILFSSCVTRRNSVYLQPSGDNKKKNITFDEIYSEFERKEHQYHLKPGDVVSIKIGSLTNSEFDFINQYAVQMGEFLYLSPKTNVNNSAGGNQIAVNTRMQQQGENKNMFSDEGKPIAVGEPQSTGFVVDKDGNIELPNLGIISARDMTLLELENAVNSKLGGFFENPEVRVQLLNFSFIVLGEVNNEGQFNTYKDNTNLFEALAMAGSPAEFADKSKIKVVREDGSTSEVAYVNLLDESFLSSPYYYVQPGDVIIVPPLGAKAFRKYGIPDAMNFVALTSSLVSIIALIYSAR